VVVFHSSIYFFDFKTFLHASWSSLKRLKLSLLLTTLISTIVLGILNLVIIVFRLLDEVIFIGYRKTKIEKPIFIISNPRSGTTYLHRLMTLDEDRFAYFLLYHTVGNSILFYKIVNAVGRIDKHIGRPFRKFFIWTEKILFTGWSDIHPMGWNKSEEDEALFTFNYSSPAVGLAYPYMNSYNWVEFPDKYPNSKASRLMSFYKNSLQRFMYSEGKGKTLITKNVLSTGRLKLILKCFPDARIIYPTRNPIQAIPSFISMFTKSWRIVNRSIPENSDEYRKWGHIAINYYKYWHLLSQEIPKNQFFSFSYEELIKDPQQTIYKIYDHFELDRSKSFEKLLSEQYKESKNYKSRHEYSLERYGLTEDFTYKELKTIFDKYNFKLTNVR